MKISILHQLHLCIIISLAGGTFQPYTVWENGDSDGRRCIQEPQRRGVEQPDDYYKSSINIENRENCNRPVSKANTICIGQSSWASGNKSGSKLINASDRT